MELIFNDEVKRFIKSLQRPAEAKLSRLIVLLGKYGQDLGMPRVKYVSKGIYEFTGPWTTGGESVFYFS